MDLSKLKGVKMFILYDYLDMDKNQGRKNML